MIRLAILMLGVAVAALAVSPLGETAAERSLHGHMVQHMLLMFLAAPLIAAGGPRALIRFAPTRLRRSLTRAGHNRWARVALSLTVAWAAFAAAQWIVHLPPVIAAAEHTALLHAGLHAVLLGVSVLFWLPIMSPGPPARPRPAIRVAYLVTAMPVGDALAIWLMSVPRPLYEGVTVHDQREAGTVMLAGSLMLAVTAAVTAWRAVAQEHRRQLRRERLEARRA
jgi:cytochrome c oxidase assembly factor CtaG